MTEFETRFTSCGELLVSPKHFKGKPYCGACYAEKKDGFISGGARIRRAREPTQNGEWWMRTLGGPSE